MAASCLQGKPLRCEFRSLFVSPSCSFRCGVDDAVIGHTLRVRTVEQPQVYETPGMVERARKLAAEGGADGEALLSPALRRRLADQVYTDSGSTYIPLRVVHANGDSKPIRITAVWNVVDSNDDDFSGASGTSRQCSNVGESPASSFFRSATSVR